MHNGSDHAHGHVHGHAEGAEEAAKLLAYLLDHNRHHAEELHVLSHDLETYGKTEAAALLHACVQDFESANEKLGRVLTQLDKE